MYGVQQPSEQEIGSFRHLVYNKYLLTFSQYVFGRFPNDSLLEGFGVFNPSEIPQDLSLHTSHGVNKLKTLNDHYGGHDVVETEAIRAELKTINTVVAVNELMQPSTQELMMHIVKTSKIKTMISNLDKLAAISLLLLILTVNCERVFPTLSCVKIDLRNYLLNKTLNHLLMISIEGPPPSNFPFDKACDK